MDIHSNARTCPASRALLVDRVKNGWRVADASRAAGISRTTAYKWLRRFRDEGRAGLADRSSRPVAMPNQTPEDRRRMVIELRRLRMSGKAIAGKLKLSRSTVSRLLRRAKLSRLRDLEPPRPANRYQWDHPGDLIHVDIKKLGRFRAPGHRVLGHRKQQSQSCGIGWEYVHVAIDDATRLAYAEVLPDEKAESCVAFMQRAIAWFESLGVPCRRVMSDNGPGYRSRSFNALMVRIGAKHIFTRPYTPRTNGKAERFIQTLMREWAYVRPYASSAQRKRVLPRWLKRYNFRRDHGSLGDKPPASVLSTTS